MLIRRAKIEDFLGIAELDRDAWKENRHSEFIPDGEHAWRFWVEHSLVVCAEEGGEVTGAVVAFPAMNGDFFLHKVFVKNTARGQGVGHSLLECLLKETDRIGARIFLTVDPENRNALNLYRSLGFVRESFVKGYYRQNEDRLLLVRKKCLT